MGHILPWPNHGGHIMWNPWQQEDEDVDHKDGPAQIKTTLDHGTPGLYENRYYTYLGRPALFEIFEIGPKSGP